MTEYSNRNNFFRAFFLHAVAVETPRGAILILGHSGAGKTTLSSLLAEKYSVVADDIIYIGQHKKNRKWYITDGKKLQSFVNNWMPLLATIRTYQAREPQLVNIPSREVCKHLMDAVFENNMMCDVKGELQRAAFVSVAEIARTYPGWRLMSNLTIATPNLVWECFS